MMPPLVAMQSFVFTSVACLLHLILQAWHGFFIGAMGAVAARQTCAGVITSMQQRLQL